MIPMDYQIENAPQQHYARVENRQISERYAHIVKYKKGPKKKPKKLPKQPQQKVVVPKQVQERAPMPQPPAVVTPKMPPEIIDPFGIGFRIHVKEMAIVKGIIDFIHEKSTMALGWPSNQSYLINQGKKIEHIHPLCFIWTILRDRSLRTKVKTFRDNSLFALKWSGFLGYSIFHDNGFGKNMERYYNHRNPNDYQNEFDAFYKALNIKANRVNPYAIKKDWKGFASVLLEASVYN